MLFRKNKYTDEELVRGCVSNDRRAQEALYRRFFPEMMRMCKRYASDEDTAIGIVNNGMMRVFKKIHLYENKGSLEGWVRRLVYNSMADYFRENARYLHFLVLDEHTETHIPATGADACFEADILAAVKTLPPASGEVFRLYAIEGFSHAEIAETLQISEGTSKWHLSTAKQKLREILTPDGRLRNELIS
jgi:RNA polymerase sigma-70 factor (ECF subfamily)